MSSSTPKIVAIVGKSGCGKTFLMALIARLVSRPFVVIVHTHQDPSYLRQLEPGLTHFVGVHRGARPLGAQWFVDRIRKGFRYVYISIYDLTPDEARAWIDSLIPPLESIGNLALIIDEAHQFCRHEFVPENLVRLPRWARSIGIDIFFVSHRLVDLSPDLRAVLTYLVMFHSDEPRDVAECMNRLGQDRGVNVLRTLAPWQHVVFDLEQRTHSPVRVL
jgi:hypothetical protein